MVARSAWLPGRIFLLIAKRTSGSIDFKLCDRVPAAELLIIEPLIECLHLFLGIRWKQVIDSHVRRRSQDRVGVRERIVAIFCTLDRHSAYLRTSHRSSIKPLFLIPNSAPLPAHAYLRALWIAITDKTSRNHQDTAASHRLRSNRLRRSDARLLETYRSDLRCGSFDCMGSGHGAEHARQEHHSRSRSLRGRHKLVKGHSFASIRRLGCEVRWNPVNLLRRRSGSDKACYCGRRRAGDPRRALLWRPGHHRGRK